MSKQVAINTDLYSPSLCPFFHHDNFNICTFEPHSPHFYILPHFVLSPNPRSINKRTKLTGKRLNYFLSQGKKTRCFFKEGASTWCRTDSPQAFEHICEDGRTVKSMLHKLPMFLLILFFYCQSPYVYVAGTCRLNYCYKVQ